jgi:glycosyltransferase involved in cell wall biosynthesis
MKFTVVIPTKDRPRLLFRCLLSLSSPSVCIRIVDDGSASWARVENRSCLNDIRVVDLIVNETSRGACHARNVGARHADTEWLCFLDDDDELVAGYMEAMEALILENPDVKAWVPDVVGGRHRQSGVILERDVQVRNRVGGCSGFLIQKSLFDQLGGFDEGLPSMQDWDLWIRLIERKALHYSGIAGVVYDSDSGQKITHNLSAKYRGLRRLYFKHESVWESPTRKQHLVRLWALRQLLEPTGTRFFKCVRFAFGWPTAVVYYLKWRKFLKKAESH